MREALRRLYGSNRSPTPPPPTTRALPHRYEALVFSSGGMRGIGHFGALAELEKYDTSKTRFFVGSSAGALAACVACLDLRAKDVFEACILPFRYVKNIRLQHLTKQYGLDSGESVDALIASIVPEGLTFSDIFRDTNRVLSVVATNVSTGKMAIFDPIRSPDMSVRDAVRMSCSVPFLFTAVHHENHVYVDGALTAAFPVSVALDTYGCTRVLGLNFETYAVTQPTTTDTMTFETFVNCIVDTVVHANSPYPVRSGATVDVCTIEMSPDVNGLSFDMSDVQKKEIYECGSVSMRVFLKKKR